MLVSGAGSRRLAGKPGLDGMSQCPERDRWSSAKPGRPWCLKPEIRRESRQNPDLTHPGAEPRAQLSGRQSVVTMDSMDPVWPLRPRSEQTWSCVRRQPAHIPPAGRRPVAVGVQARAPSGCRVSPRHLLPASRRRPATRGLRATPSRVVGVLDRDRGGARPTGYPDSYRGADGRRQPAERR